MRILLPSMNVLLVLLLAIPSAAAILFDEVSNGDLSNDGTAPTMLGTLIPGESLVVGEVGNGDTTDAFSFEVPAGWILQNVMVSGFAPAPGDISTPLIMYDGTSSAAPQIEFRNVTASAVGTDLLQFDSIPGPQGPGVYTLRWGTETSSGNGWEITLVLVQVLDWIEEKYGDLSNDGASPSNFGMLPPGDNLVAGTVGASGDVSDAFTFEIPSYGELVHVWVTDYDPGTFNTFTPLALYDGNASDAPQIEFRNVTASAVGTDLLQFDSAPGPQGPGSYTIVWGTEVNDEATWGLTLEVVYDFSPVIQSVTDVGDDQGGAVRVTWSPSPLDPAGVVNYVLFRRIGAQKSVPPGDWDHVGSVPAIGMPQYSAVVPTLCDSTISGGLCESVFFIRTTTDVPTLFYDSQPDSGWSVDNLAPSIPGGTLLADGMLSWEEPVDGDFQYFSVYGSMNGGANGTEVLVGYTTGTSFDVSGVAHAFFLVTATDFAGNESPAAVVTGGVSDVPASAGTRTALIGNNPNPFNPTTVIEYELAEPSAVRLCVYNIEGRLVRELESGVMRPAGGSTVRWDGKDETGRQVASGVYFYRLETASYLETKSMTLVK